MRYKVYENPANGHQEKVSEGFNWWVFLFGPIWYFFNDMPGAGLGWLALAIFVATVTVGFGGLVVWAIAGFTANDAKSASYLRHGWRLVGYEQDGIFVPADKDKDYETIDV